MRIIILLDRSGSMISNIDQTIAGYNEFLDNQRKLQTVDECLVSLYTFAYDIETVYENRPVSQAETLNVENYIPDGGTALYDSLAYILGKIGQDPVRTILLVITDGEENSSSEHTSENIRAMLEGKDELLEVVYLGSNQDAILAGNTIGSQVSVNYSDNHTDQVYRNLSAAMTRVRSGQTPNIQFTQEELASQI